MGKVIRILEKILDKTEPDITIELEEIIYSKKHGHEICIMHLIGKNIFPKMTAGEILENPKAMAGLRKEDLIKITRLDMEIKLKRNRLRIIETDRNGTVVLENAFREKKRYSEKIISSDPIIQNQLEGRESYSMGYRFGFKEGLRLNQQKKMLINKIWSLFRWRNK